VLDAERAEHPDASVEIWSEDEARLGLIPIIRRVWSLRGQRPVAMGRRRYQWLYVYGFVRPTTGDVQWLLLPTVSTEAFGIALAEFARAVRASAHKRILLVIDGAELQPAERLWPLLHEPLANRTVETLDELEDCLVDRCRYLADVPDEIRPRVAYHWWPDDAAAAR
jgi:hypothetical protein